VLARLMTLLPLQFVQPHSLLSRFPLQWTCAPKMCELRCSLTYTALLADMSGAQTPARL